jgi:hypothetical protein
MGQSHEIQVGYSYNEFKLTTRYISKYWIQRGLLEEEFEDLGQEGYGTDNFGTQKQLVYQ